MFMRNVGVLSRSAYCMTWGRARNHFFSCGKSLHSRHFWMCFLSSHAVFMNGARHNNEPAHRDMNHYFSQCFAASFMHMFERGIIHLNAYIKG